MYHLQSTSMFVIFCQISYMQTSHVFLYSEKLELAKYYSGEICDLMAFYETYRSIIIYSYLIAILLKLYNMYF